MVTVTLWAWPCVELLCTWRDENPHCSDCRSLRHFKVSGDFCQTAACGVPRTPPSSATRLSELRSHPGGCFRIVAPVVCVSSADANCCIVLFVLRSRIQVRAAHRKAAVRAQPGREAVPRPFTFPDVTLPRENQVGLIKQGQRAKRQPQSVDFPETKH